MTLLTFARKLKKKEKRAGKTFSTAVLKDWLEEEEEKEVVSRERESSERGERFSFEGKKKHFLLTRL